MTNLPVNILLPVYNAESYLSDALNSLFAQSYSDFEIIAIDDGSTDSSLHILNSYAAADHRLHVYHFIQNQGLLKTLVFGLDKCTADFIFRMDADDISHPHRIEKQLDYMISNSLDICGTSFEAFTTSNNSTCALYQCYPPRFHIDYLLYLSINSPFAHGSVAFRASFLKLHKLNYNCNSSFNNAEDYSFWIDFWNHGARFGSVTDVLYYLRLSNSSLSTLNQNNLRQDRFFLSSSFISSNISALHNYSRAVKAEDLTFLGRIYLSSLRLRLFLHTKTLRDLYFFLKQSPLLILRGIHEYYKLSFGFRFFY